MNPLDETKSRQIIPRWRDSSQTLGTLELAPLSLQKPQAFLGADDELAKRLKDWQSEHGNVFASDLIGTALVIDKNAEAATAAEHILSHKADATPAMIALANQLLIRLKGKAPRVDQQGSPNHKAEIRTLRQKVNREPRNPIAWVDMARHYTNLGLHQQAKLSLAKATALAPDHRFVIRSAARFFLHIGDPEHALALLRRASRLKSDPWLLAADIATSAIAKKTPKHTKAAKQLLEEDRFLPGQITELASALGTLELEHGSNKQSRKLFTQSLILPTENTVAQAEWVSKKLGTTIVEAKHLELAKTFEARAIGAYNNDRFSNAFDNAMAWLLDEPFSTKPAQFAAFVSSVALEDYESAVRVAKAGLSANPSNQGLRNSVVFALTLAGKLEEARQAFAEVNFQSASEYEKILLTATRGLLAYRLGDRITGNAAYNVAVEAATMAKLPAVHAAALAYWAREEILAKGASADAIYSKAMNELKKYQNIKGYQIIKRMLERTRKQPNSKASNK